MNINKAYNFKTVNECVTCSGTLKGVNLLSLAEAGYEVVINLLPDENEYAVKDERIIVEGQGLRYEYIPVDWDNPQQSDFESFEKILESCKEQKVHIHCAANYRVSAFYSIYAVKNLGWSKSQSEDFINSIWDRNEYPQWEAFVSDYII